MELNYITIMFRTEDLLQESQGKKGSHPVQKRHTKCNELSSYRSRNARKGLCL